MNENENEQTTLRDSIEQAIETVETQHETSEQKAERVRDEQGRFAPKEEIEEKANKSEVKQTKNVPQNVPQNVSRETKDVQQVEQNVPRETKLQRPSSWKKEMWPVWDKLTKGEQLLPEESIKLAEYNSQREQDFAKGVSTYKQEWESAKPILDAMAQFKPLLDQHGIQPTEWIGNLGNAHKMLALGTPEQKLSMFVKLAQDYQVPLQALLTQGQDGKVYFNPQIQAYQAPQQNFDPRQTVRDILEEEKINQEVASFVSNTDQYPYIEQVKDTMAGLLQAGLAHDLKSAYDAALRLPAHSDLFESMQQQQQLEQVQKEREQKARQVQGARAKAVSPKTSTPAGSSSNGKAKGLREMLSDNFDEIVSSRV
jgi:hypothetical protein